MKNREIFTSTFMSTFSMVGHMSYLFLRMLNMRKIDFNEKII